VATAESSTDSIEREQNRIVELIEGEHRMANGACFGDNQ
jgi:hypothetical protein